MAEKPSYKELEKRIKELEQVESEHKRTVEFLRKNEERWRSMAINIPAFITVVDRDHRVLSINRTFSKHTTQQVVGTNVTDYTAPEHRKNVKEKIEGVFKTGHPVTFKNRGISSDNKLIWYENYLSPIDEQQPVDKIIFISQNITKRMQAEEALRESEQFANFIINSMKDGVFVLNDKFQYIVWNPSMKELSGVSNDNVIKQNKLPWELFPHLSKVGIDKVMQRAMKGETILNQEAPYFLQSGKSGYTSESYFPLTQDGQIKGIIGVIRDITESKRAERQLLESKEKYSKTFHSAPVIIAISNLKTGKYIDINETFLKLLGYNREEVIGHTSIELKIFSSENREKVQQLLSKNKAFYNITMEMHTKSGSPRIAMFSGQVIEIEGEECIVSVAEDITRQKQAEYVMNVQHDLGIALSTTDNIGEALDLVLKAAISFEGIDSGAIYLDDPATGGFDLAYGKGYSAEFTELIQHYDKETPNIKMVIQGTPVYASYVKMGLPLDDVRIKEGIKATAVVPIIHMGKTVGCLNATSHIIDDIPIITRNAMETMASQVGGAILRLRTEADKDYLQALLQQSQKMEAIGTLAGGIAHDFNNVLQSIIGYTELTKEDVPEGSLAQSNLQEVFKSAMRAKDMVQQILAFSRKADTKKNPIKVQSVVMEALKLLRTSIPSTIEIRQNIDADCRLVLADSTQIHQVVMNLATNAYQAMRDEGGVLELTLMEEEISSDDSGQDLDPGAYLKLTISDTGHGIGNVVIGKIFEPYFTTKGPGEGTGMGLSVVHGIVRDHGGDIKVYSELGEGTAFHVYLPLIETKPVEPITVLSGLTPTGTEHILLVDDDESIVLMTQQVLERLGYQVTSRTSSVEALEAFKARPDQYDLIITDMTMPNMTGIQLAPRLKEIRSDIPIVVCTGFSEMIDEDNAEALGLHGFVMKPIVIREIAATIRDVLDKRQEK